jgi:hypothetical protein
MCENWSFDVLILFLKCAVSEVLYLVSDEHYTEADNCLVSDEEKGRHALITRVSHLKSRETRLYYACLLPQEKRDA